jgi:hypothetical protein
MNARRRHGLYSWARYPSRRSANSFGRLSAAQRPPPRRSAGLRPPPPEGFGSQLGSDIVVDGGDRVVFAVRSLAVVLGLLTLRRHVTGVRPPILGVPSSQPRASCNRQARHRVIPADR